MWFPNTALLKLHHLTEKLWLYGSSSNMLPSGGGSARTTSAAALRLRQRLQEQSIQQHLLDGGEDQDGDDIVQLPSGEAEDDEEEDDEDDDEERFKPLDIKGTSIRKVYSSSIKHWNAFALIQKYPQFDDLTPDDVTGRVLENGSLANTNDPPIRKKMAEFANYLFNAKKKKSGKDSGKNLKTKVQLQYLSGVKTVLFDEHKALAFTNTCDWYEELYSGLRLRASVAAIARGEAISKKTVGFSRKTLANCCRFLMKQENEGLGYEERCVILILFHAVGRGGEVSTSTWNSAQWEEEREFLSLDWGELKKGQQYLMTFHPDAKDWVLDVYHAIACYLIGGHGKAKASTSTSATNGINWILKGYVDMKDGGASTKVSSILEKCYKSGVEGVHEGASSHGLRVTATDDMVFNPLLAIFATIARGGWDFKGDNLAFQYFTAKLHVVMAGKVLAGWQDPNMKVSAPTIEAFKTTTNQESVDAFCASLFAGKGVPELNEPRLRGFRDAMVASLLMYYDDVKKELTLQSKIIMAIHGAAREHDIDLKTLSEWGTAVRYDFQAKNAANMGDADASEAKRAKMAVKMLSNIVSVQQNNYKDLSCKVDTLLENQTDLSGKVDTLTENQTYMISVLDEIASRGQNPFPQGTKRKPDSTAATQARAAKRSPSSLSSSSATKPTAPTAFDRMANSSRVNAALNFSNCNMWTCADFVLGCAKQNQDVDKATRLQPWLGKNLAPGKTSSTVNTMRGRCKEVYLALRDRASADQKIYFKPSKYPLTSAEKSEWEREVESFVPGLADDLITELLQELCGLNSIEYTPDMKKEHGAHIGGIATIFENIRKIRSDMAKAEEAAVAAVAEASNS